MPNNNLEHPSEETLERFLLQRSEDQETEEVETHVLACESCVTRLEAMELQLADLKTALVGFEHDRIQNELQPAASPWKKWFGLPTLSWAGAACAALLLGITVIPSYLHRPGIGAPGAAEQTAGADLSVCAGPGVTLASCRGTDSTTLLAGHALYLRLDTTDIPAGPIDVQVVSGNGQPVWQGQTQVKDERAEVRLPRIAQSGPYFLRFYAPSASVDRELLREYRFELK